MAAPGGMPSDYRRSSRSILGYERRRASPHWERFDHVVGASVALFCGAMPVCRPLPTLAPALDEFLDGTELLRRYREKHFGISPVGCGRRRDFGAVDLVVRPIEKLGEILAGTVRSYAHSKISRSIAAEQERLRRPHPAFGHPLPQAGEGIWLGSTAKPLRLEQPPLEFEVARLGKGRLEVPDDLPRGLRVAVEEVDR